jgi:AraC-like DNA-binding protein
MKITPHKLNREKIRELVTLLKESETYQSYRSAFTTATGLPLALEPANAWGLPDFDQSACNPFCKLIGSGNRGCAACLRSMGNLNDGDNNRASTKQCEFGLHDSSIPVTIAGETVAYLYTGQVLFSKPTKATLSTLKSTAAKLDLSFDQTQLRESFKQTKVTSQETYLALIQMLESFADHLATVANKIVIQGEHSEPPLISRAKGFINENYDSELSLGSVARVANVSVYYFCKLFKKFTGLNFTDYLARVRIEKAKDSLLDPNLRVSEIAYAVGFQSLTHFNRMFKKLVGCSPTEYRNTLPSIARIAA